MAEIIDRFEEQPSHFAFPCCACIHRYKMDSESPCRHCIHNCNATTDEQGVPNDTAN